MSVKSFSDRTVLITGGSRGIGRAASLRLASEGARVAVNYVSNVAKANETVAEIEAAGGVAVAVQGNVAIPAEAAQIATATRDAFGPIDMLVHSAGISIVEHASDVTWETWRKTMDVNDPARVRSRGSDFINRRFAGARKSGALLGVKSCGHRDDPLPRSGMGEAQHPHQLYLPWPDRNRDGVHALSGNTPRNHEGHSDGPYRPTGRHLQRHPIFAERRIQLHDRPDSRRQRRPSHAPRLGIVLYLVDWQFKIDDARAKQNARTQNLISPFNSEKGTLGA
jgi:hypothetical protein